MPCCTLPELLLLHFNPRATSLALGSALGFGSVHRIDSISHRTVTDWSPSDIPHSDAEPVLCSQGIQKLAPAQQQLPVSLAQLSLQK